VSIDATLDRSLPFGVFSRATKINAIRLRERPAISHAAKCKASKETIERAKREIPVGQRESKEREQIEREIHENWQRHEPLTVCIPHQRPAMSMDIGYVVVLDTPRSLRGYAALRHRGTSNLCLRCSVLLNREAERDKV
jgi:hypothetical protein